jgi:predicted 3-demethylubiquinone-9 3-methyltransferase (glyoxalase superfamily)
MPNITPFLWFDTQAEEAANFYVQSSPIRRSPRSFIAPKSHQTNPSDVLTVAFELNGHNYIALNGGPHYKFTEAVSLFVSCKTQEEIDHYWSALTADGGQEVACGWLKDKYGLFWQIAPEGVLDLLASSDRAKANRVMAAVMNMTKLDVAQLERASAQG